MTTYVINFQFTRMNLGLQDTDEVALAWQMEAED